MIDKNFKGYELINVYQRHSDLLNVFRCFKSLSSSMYYVQSMDTLYVPFDNSKLMEMNCQVMELFQEEDIVERTEGYKSLNEAIASFIDEFEDC